MIRDVCLVEPMCATILRGRATSPYCRDLGIPRPAHSIQRPVPDSIQRRAEQIAWPPFSPVQARAQLLSAADAQRFDAGDAENLRLCFFAFKTGADLCRASVSASTSRPCTHGPAR